MWAGEGPFRAYQYVCTIFFHLISSSSFISIVEDAGLKRGFRSFVFVPRLAVHPDGKCYASGGEDGFVRVHHFEESYFKAKPYGDLEIDD